MPPAAPDLTRPAPERPDFTEPDLAAATNTALHALDPSSATPSSAIPSSAILHFRPRRSRLSGHKAGADCKIGGGAGQPAARR